MRNPMICLLLLALALAGCTPAPSSELTILQPTATTPAAVITDDATASPLVLPADPMTATAVASMSLITSPLAAPAITITMPASGEVGDCNWMALHDLQSASAATLRVTGVCIMPTPGYTLTLERAEPQGVNPAILLLHLTIEPPTGIVAQVLSPAEVVYEETTDQRFDQVSILAEGSIVESVDIDVEEVP